MWYIGVQCKFGSVVIWVADRLHWGPGHCKTTVDIKVRSQEVRFRVFVFLEYPAYNKYLISFLNISFEKYFDSGSESEKGCINHCF